MTLVHQMLKHRELSDVDVQRGAQLAIRVWEWLLVSQAQHVLCLLRPLVFEPSHLATLKPTAQISVEQ